MATLEELAQRIQVLEDLEAIKNLKARYGQLADARHDSYGRVKGKEDLEFVASEIAKLFTEDAVWDGGKEFGIYKGRKEIYEHFLRPVLKFEFHYFVEPNITIGGDKAHGRWYLLLPATMSDNTLVWIAGFEDDEYVKIDGQWLMSYMKLTVLFSAFRPRVGESP